MCIRIIYERIFMKETTYAIYRKELKYEQIFEEFYRYLHSDMFSIINVFCNFGI